MLSLKYVHINHGAQRKACEPHIASGNQNCRHWFYPRLWRRHSAMHVNHGSKTHNTNCLSDCSSIRDLHFPEQSPGRPSNTITIQLQTCKCNSFFTVTKVNSWTTLPSPPYIMPQIGAMYSKGGCSLHNSFKQFYLFWACCLSWHYTQCWCTGDDDLTGAECSDLFYDVSQFHQTLTATTSIISCCITSLNGLIFCYRLMQLKGSVKEPNKFPERTE